MLPCLHPRDQFWCQTYSPSHEPGFTVTPQAPADRSPSTTDKSLYASNSQPTLPWRSDAGKAACREACFPEGQMAVKAPHAQRGDCKGSAHHGGLGSPPTAGDIIQKTWAGLLHQISTAPPCGTQSIPLWSVGMLLRELCTPPDSQALLAWCGFPIMGM